MTCCRGGYGVIVYVERAEVLAGNRTGRINVDYGPALAPEARENGLADPTDNVAVSFGNLLTCVSRTIANDLRWIVPADEA